MIPFLLAAGMIVISVCSQQSLAAGDGDEVIAGCWQGLSSDDADWKECDLGDYVADAIREESGADVSLIPAGCLGMALAGDGTITRQEASDSILVDGPVWVYEISSARLRQLLEQGVSSWALSETERLDPEVSASADYLQISGMEVKYDASAPAGERVVQILVAGNKLDLTAETDRIRVSATTALAIDSPGTDTGRTLTEMLCDYIIAQGDVVPGQRARVHVIGANAANIISYVPPGIVLFIVIILGVNAVLRRREDGFGR